MNFKTPTAAIEIGITEANLHYLLRAKKITSPERDSSGHYVWTHKDIQAARSALRIDRRKTKKGGRPMIRRPSLSFALI
jgi:DNA-binding transcriptional MerR regulator